jgi:hypothetical protein
MPWIVRFFSIGAVGQKFLGDDDPQSVVMRGGGDFDVKTH